jgi:hypothetical protein
MEKHIYVSNYSTNGVDLGEINNYEIFKGKHFEQTNHDANSNIIHKALIYSIHFEPDSTYFHTDGYSGTCWLAKILDSAEDENMTFYHFRNFENLIQIFKEKGYTFIK